GPPALNGATAALVSRNFPQRACELRVKCRLLRGIEGDQRRVRRLRGGRIGGSSARSPFGNEVGRVFVLDAVDRVVDRRMDNGQETSLNGRSLSGSEDSLFGVGVPVGDDVGRGPEPE